MLSEDLRALRRTSAAPTSALPRDKFRIEDLIRRPADGPSRSTQSVYVKSLAARDLPPAAARRARVTGMDMKDGISSSTCFRSAPRTTNLPCFLLQSRGRSYPRGLRAYRRPRAPRMARAARSTSCRLREGEPIQAGVSTRDFTETKCSSWFADRSRAPSRRPSSSRTTRRSKRTAQFIGDQHPGELRAALRGAP